MEFWANITKLYSVILETQEILAKIINGRLGEYDKVSSMVTEKDWLPEQLQTTRNLCDTALLLIEHNRRELLPTILELLHWYTQTIIDTQCVVSES